MSKTLRIDGDTSTITISDAGTSLNSLTSPQDYYSNLNFHSGLPYIKKADTITTTVSFTKVEHATISWTDESSGCGGLSVICTVYKDLLGKDVYESDSEYGKMVGKQVYYGYTRWGVPVANFIKKHKVAKRLLQPFVLMWAQEMHKQVSGKGVGSLVGRGMIKVGIPLCKFLGRK